jgi:murein DD-endopeptidase MepM/ murein hydrolase activator NlpD
MNGTTAIPQRFAVDFALLGDDGRLFSGQGTSLSEWYAFGSPVLAVASGRVAFAADGQEDRPPFGAGAAVLEPKDATGNTVILDLGQGRFATYAHLQAGSVRVATGDRVAAGALLGRIGNSGHSLGPHLHFHLSDADSPLAGEGCRSHCVQAPRSGARTVAQLQGTPLPIPEQPARDVAEEMP